MAGMSPDDVRRILRERGAPASSESLSWSDVPGKAFSNAPDSAGQFVQNMIYPFLHPIETAESFYEIGAGLLSKAGVVDADEATVDAIGQFFVDRYGSMENLKKTLATDPVGVAADAATVLSGGAALGARAPGMIGQTARVAGKVGRAIDPLAVAGKTLKATGKAASVPLGLTTGAGSRAIQEAGRAGLTGNKTFTRHMRGKGDISEPVAMAKRGMGVLRKERSDAYKSGMAGIRTDPTTLDLNPVGQAILAAEDKIYLEGVAKSDDAVKTLSAIKAKMREYANLPPTIEVLDHMKQAIGEIQQKAQFGTLERSIADDIYNATKDTIVKQAPQYADVMKGYGEASDTLNELNTTFSLGPKASKDTTVRKLQSTMRNNVNTNYGRRTQLADELSKLEPELTPAIAGQALSSLPPRSIQGTIAGSAIPAAAFNLIDPTYLLTLPTTSPRAVGEAAYMAGRAGAVGSKLAPAGRASQQGGRIVRDLAMPALGASGAGASGMTPEEVRKLLNGR